MENKNLVLNNNRSTYFLFWQYYIKYDNLVNELNKFNLLQFSEIILLLEIYNISHDVANRTNVRIFFLCKRIDIECTGEIKEQPFIGV